MRHQTNKMTIIPFSFFSFIFFTYLLLTRERSSGLVFFTQPHAPTARVATPRRPCSHPPAGHAPAAATSQALGDRAPRDAGPGPAPHLRASLARPAHPAAASLALIPGTAPPSPGQLPTTAASPRPGRLPTVAPSRLPRRSRACPGSYELRWPRAPATTWLSGGGRDSVLHRATPRGAHGSLRPRWVPVLSDGVEISYFLLLQLILFFFESREK